MFVTALATSHRMMRRMIGSPASGMAGFARTSVSGRRRVPRPAVSTRAVLTGSKPPIGRFIEGPRVTPVDSDAEPVSSAPARPEAGASGSPLSEHHIAGWNAAFVAVAHEKGAVRIDDEVGRTPAKRVDRRADAAIT